MKLLVVGAGAMGRWFAESVLGPDDSVGFADTDEDAAIAAADATGGHLFRPGDGDTYDLVCVAVPMPVASSVIAEYAQFAGEAICDVTGSMQDPIESMRSHAPDVERMSLHPLFAPERSPGNVAVVTDEPGDVTDTVRRRLRAAGNDVVETTPAEHDEAMETVQARAHTAVLAFALAADDVPDHFQTPISGALFDLVETVTAGEARVYSDIQAAFDGADDVATAARELADADAEAFADIYEQLS